MNRTIYSYLGLNRKSLTRSPIACVAILAWGWTNPWPNAIFEQILVAHPIIHQFACVILAFNKFDLDLLSSKKSGLFENSCHHFDST